MSQEERKLMQLMDERILNATPKELSKLQQADINTQLDGIWFYDICNVPDSLSQKPNITTFSKVVFLILNLNEGFSDSIICLLNLNNLA